MSSTAQPEVLGFQTEIRQLLHLMIHSLYGNKEIFLRELVSNASDACDKLRFEALTDSALLEDDPELGIRITIDEAARTISVADNGVGMSRDEVIANIGTIAKSGTREFLQQLSGDQAKDAQLIGQFGVGFYSSFMVADKVTLMTRRAGMTPEHGVRWESSGEGDYTIETTVRLRRGTEVTLHIRAGDERLLDAETLKGILRKYSDHITLPIHLGDEQVNQASAIWARPKSDISEDQYHEFYKHVAHDVEAPLAYTHARVEGRHEFTQLLFVPSRAPFDLWNRELRRGIKLYVRRVFVMDDAEQLMPAYLRFVRGIVDSNDLPLNVSREILQQSDDVDAIRNASVKRVLGLLEDLAAKQPEKYTKFWSEFGQVFKEGPGEDPANGARIGKLLRFASTHDPSGAQSVSFADYVSRMKEGQTSIYYITADTDAAARHSPHLEVFAKVGVEVLLLSDRVDEWLVAHFPEFDGKPLESIAKGDLDLGAIAPPIEEPAAETASDVEALVSRIQAALSDKAKEVRVTHRLTESAACLVADRHGISTNLERLLKSAGQKVPAMKPVLEINPKHPLVAVLKEESDDERFAAWSHVLFDQAVLAEGGQLDDPASFVKRLNDLMLTMKTGSSRIWMP